MIEIMKLFMQVVLIALSSISLSGCFGTVMTGVGMVYDRHNIYKKISDFQLAANVRRALYKDSLLKCKTCYIDVESFNRDLLLAGHVPNRGLRDEAERRVKSVEGYRRVFVHLGINKQRAPAIEDSWITAKIRSGILADSSINPKKFRVATSDGVVYLMGDVDPKQARKVIQIARTTSGVKRVVKMFRYYHLTNKQKD